MNNYITGKIIKELREKEQLTQLELADIYLTAIIFIILIIKIIVIIKNISNKKDVL